VISVWKAEEPNLLHARALARRRGWWKEVIGAMQGVQMLYIHTGRASEWAQLVEEIVPDFVDPGTDGPLACQEGSWSVVTEYRVRLAREERRWVEAERLQRIAVDWDRRHQRAEDRNSVRTLAVALEQLGQIQHEMARPECVAAYSEALDLAIRVEDGPLAAVAAFDLGRAYEEQPALRNLDEAERWYRRSLGLTPGGDLMSRASCLAQLGSVDYQRFKEARAAEKPAPELRRHLRDALQRYGEALEMTPPDAVRQLAATHGSLGNIYDDAGDVERALHHYREAIRLNEASSDLYAAARTRFNFALVLAKADRIADARQYADAALRGFQTHGSGAADDVQQALDLISDLAKATTP
jgi:tetratricopeptide (TPR) repeat protein